MLRAFLPVVIAAAALAFATAPSPESEAVRLQRHFAVVEHELLSRDVSSLTSEQRAARARHIARLHAYAEAGVFPRNTDHPGRRVPYFIDRLGTRCAMAYLIERSGPDGAAYVRRVAARMNNAYVGDIARDPELGAPLLAWLEQNGLSVNEAARIQPAYGEPVPIPEPRQDYGPAVRNGVASAAITASLMDWGLSEHTAGWLRVASGALGILVGVSTVNETGNAYDVWAVLNLGLGVASLAMGVEGLAARPVVTPEGGPGLRVSMTF